jgi:bacteriorhodopsin
MGVGAIKLAAIMIICGILLSVSGYLMKYGYMIGGGEALIRLVVIIFSAKIVSSSRPFESK